MRAIGSRRVPITCTTGSVRVNPFKAMYGKAAYQVGAHTLEGGHCNPEGGLHMAREWTEEGGEQL